MSARALLPLLLLTLAAPAAHAQAPQARLRCRITLFREFAGAPSVRSAPADRALPATARARSRSTWAW
jgi:hypothetical protein